MSDIEYEGFKNNLLQRPITFLTEENLDELETHCRRAIRYERGNEHKVVLELLERYKEHLAEREQKDKRIKELEKENRKLKVVRIEYDYGYENIHFCTKNDLVRIDKNKYLIEIKDGKFIDIKQLYIDSLDSIPKQKVKDKIEEIKEDKESKYFDKFLITRDINYAIEILEELLEDK